MGAHRGASPRYAHAASTTKTASNGRRVVRVPCFSKQATTKTLEQIFQLHNSGRTPALNNPLQLLGVLHVALDQIH